MGVHGLWKLLEPTGKPVPLETLENKVLAVDVSIWLHQAAQGLQDGRGQAVHNAPLLGLFHRLCKLLFCRVRPVFVFDGAAPPLKQRTVAARRQRRTAAEERAEHTRRRLVRSRLEAAALEAVLAAREGRAPAPSQGAGPATVADMFVLPAPERPGSGSGGEFSEEEEEEETGRGTAGGAAGLDLHAVDVNSAQFRALPADVRHDILTELRETRKQSSWGRLHEMPRVSGDFSQYQMRRLLKRRSVQEALENAEKEMGGRAPSLAELHAFMTEAGGALAGEAPSTDGWGGLSADPGRRIAANSAARFLLLKTTGTEAQPSDHCSHNDSGPELAAPLGPLPSSLTSSIPGPSSAPQPSSSSVDPGAGTSSGLALAQEKKALEDSTLILSNYFLDVIEEEEEVIMSGIPSDQKSKASKTLGAVQDFMTDNSDLSQEEILALIQSQKTDQKLKDQLRGGNSSKIMDQSLDENSCRTSSGNTSNTHGRRFSTDTTEVESDKILLKVTSNTLDGKQDKCKSMERSKIISQETTTQNGELKKTDTISEMYMTGKEETESSEGELEDVPESVGLQVVVKPGDLNPTEDIFADVFTNGPESSCKHNTCREVQVVTDIFEDVSVPLTSNKINDQIVSISTTGKTSKEKSLVTDIGPVSNTENSSIQCTLHNEAINTLTVQREHSEENLIVESGSMTPISPTTFPEEMSQLEDDLLHSDSDGPTSSVPPVISTAGLQELQDIVLAECVHLNNEQARESRLATGITDQVVREAQELLQLFGIPYIIAPMEAEAQCAFLDMMSLTDGTITDDSDIWLFGGRRVYKNFFNHKKHVLQFRDVDIKHYFKLARAQLVLLALLVGSDYTLGLPGVGPVTALEILAAFPASTGSVEAQLAGLDAFREWCMSGKAGGKGRTSLRNKLKDLQLSRDFPSTAVVEAYLSPKVDKSLERFTWGKPDIEGIAEFSRIKFGWTESKTHDILQPIMKKLCIKITQLPLESYFQPKPRLPISEGTLSKRVQQAVNKLGAECNSSSEDDQPIPAKQPRLHANLIKEQKISKGKKQNANMKEKGQVIGSDHSRGSQSTNSKADIPSKSFGREFILQREKDKLNLLKNKLKAIEVFRKSSKGLDCTKRDPKFKRKVLKEANLSEGSSSDDS